MRNIKIAHEAPKSIFKEVQELTDYDYFLANVLETDSEYVELALQSKAAGREIILDNGVFETGEALDMSKFAEWVRKIKPTYYIVPDVLENYNETVVNMSTWIRNFKQDVPEECQMMGVVQGKNYADLKRCYLYLNHCGCDKIAFSFDLSAYKKMFPHENELVSWCFGRILMLNKMMKEGVINTDKKHHLLGAGLIREFTYYPTSWAWIDSVDTSSPVVHGLAGIAFEPRIGNEDKIKTKLYTMMNQTDIDEMQHICIKHNIDVFRDFCTLDYF